MVIDTDGGGSGKRGRYPKGLFQVGAIRFRPTTPSSRSCNSFHDTLQDIFRLDALGCAHHSLEEAMRKCKASEYDSPAIMDIVTRKPPWKQSLKQHGYLPGIA